MSAVFESVRCAACSGRHDVYVFETVVKKRVHEFTCPTTGQRVTLSPRGKAFRQVEIVPPGAVLATICDVGRQ